ncbi:hypothetical protein HDU86_004269 [Geranomyces michiganensis]|nr:hypothetical protein HDU86_004269 [Geranomyces michiganensis]
MPALPYTVAQQITNYLYIEMVIETETNLFLSLALTCHAFKTAVYQHRKALMMAQATAVLNRPVTRGFPFPRSAKNPLIDLDCLFSDCIVAAPEKAQKFLDKYREHFDHDMEDGRFAIIAEGGLVYISSRGRYLYDFSAARPECLVMKDVICVRKNDYPLSVEEKYAVFYEKIGEREIKSYMWTASRGTVKVLDSQLHFKDVDTPSP